MDARQFLPEKVPISVNVRSQGDRKGNEQFERHGFWQLESCDKPSGRPQGIAHTHQLKQVAAWAPPQVDRSSVGPTPGWPQGSTLLYHGSALQARVVNPSLIPWVGAHGRPPDY